MTSGPDDLDRIAAEIALMLDPTHYGADDLPGMTPEIRAARRRIAARYDELKVKLPFMDSARRARAEVVADWLRRRLESINAQAELKGHRSLEEVAEDLACWHTRTDPDTPDRFRVVQAVLAGIAYGRGLE